MALSNLLRETLQSRNSRPWLLPSSSTTSLKIFFIYIFSFKISSLGLKDFVFPFLSYLDKFILFFYFAYLLHHVFFLSFSAFLSLFVFDFLFLFFCSILMTNIFYHIAFLTRHIRVIKSALIILLQRPGIIARNF